MSYTCFVQPEPCTHHIVAFVLDVGDHAAELFQAVHDHLLVVRLRRADALEVELLQALAQRPLRP